MIDCVRTVSQALKVTAGVVDTLTINKKRMRSALTVDMLATDLADYLVKKSVPFRETHHISGAVVKKAEDNDTTIDCLELGELQKICPQFEADVEKVFDFDQAVERRTSTGGTCKQSVLDQAAQILKLLQSEVRKG